MTFIVNDTGGGGHFFDTSSERNLQHVIRCHCSSFDDKNTKQNSFLLAGMPFLLVYCLQHVALSIASDFFVLHIVSLMNNVE